MERFCTKSRTHGTVRHSFLRCNTKGNCDGPSSSMQLNQPRSVLRPWANLRPPALRLTRTMRTHQWNAKATNNNGDDDAAASNYDNPLGNDDFLTYFADIKLSSWRPEFADQVATLVKQAQTISTGLTTFNPEGNIEDCRDADSFYFEQGGVFLVATMPIRSDDKDEEKVVGCVAFAIGDEVSHLRSGASISDPERTYVAAIRRLCVAPTADNSSSNAGGSETGGAPLQAFLLRTAQRLAAAFAASSNTGEANVALESIALGWEGGGNKGMALCSKELQAAGFTPTGRFSYAEGGISLQEFSKTIPLDDNEAGTETLGRSGWQQQKSQRPEEMIEVITAGGSGIGMYPRPYVEQYNLLHRAIGCLVTDENGCIYIHQRSPAKSVHPSMYDTYVGGLVVAGERPAEAARNELFEELGIDVDKHAIGGLEPTFIAPFMGKRNRVLVHCYRVVLPAGAELQHKDGEVVWGTWATPEQVKKMVSDDEKSFVPGGLAMWRETLQRGIVN